MVRGIVRFLRHALAVAAVLVSGLPAQSEEKRWQILTPGDPLFSDEAPGAALMLDSRLAAINYLPDMDGWLATLGFPAKGTVTSLTSRLINKNGTSASMQLGADQLITAFDAETGAALVSFSFAEKDVARFRRAVTWEISVAGETLRIPLNGSARALRQVLDLRAGQEVPVAAE